MEHPSLTPYSDVNEILHLLHNRAKEILQEDLTGMYLYGSLSSGDFNPQTSDIDFLFVTERLLPKEKIEALRSMHEQLWASGLKWASHLEGSYVPKDLIRRHNPDGARCPCVNEGSFYLGQLGSDWIIQRHVVREMGVILEGPDPGLLIDVVTPDDIRAAVYASLEEWWFPMLEDPAWLKQHESNYHGYAVITMCRVLHALEHGSIVSKPAAVAWAKRELDPQWLPLIDQAVASQDGNHADFLDEAIEFIQYVRERTSKPERANHG